MATRWIQCMANATSSTLGSLRNVGLPTALIAIGLLLFVIPEPITSVLGALVAIVGVGGWLVSKLL